MKRILLVFVIALSLLFSSCRHPETYTFLNPIDEIAEIIIVKVSFDDNGNMIEEKVQQVEDQKAFIADFRDVNCFTYYGDPTGVTPEGVEDTVIKILYKNDEYELINWKGQAEYTSEKGFRYYAGYSVFDEQAFEALIEEYLQGLENK